MNESKIDLIFKAIADPTRRKIFNMAVIAGAALSITQISNEFDISRQGVTKHIKTLEEAGLVNVVPKGRERFCFANPKQLKEVHTWLSVYEKFWDNKLNALDDFLNNENI